MKFDSAMATQVNMLKNEKEATLDELEKKTEECVQVSLSCMDAIYWSFTMVHFIGGTEAPRVRSERQPEIRRDGDSNSAGSCDHPRENGSSKR